MTVKPRYVNQILNAVATLFENKQIAVANPGG